MSQQQNTQPAILRLENVRLAFVQVFQPKAMEGGEPKYSVVCLMDNEKHLPLLQKIEKIVDRLKVDAFGSASIRLKGELLRDGSEKQEIEGFGDGITFLTASSKKRPPVVDGQMSPITEEDGRVYSGCYGNVSVEFWPRGNTPATAKFGKRINAQLRAVQFVKDGESFGGGGVPVNVEKEFEVQAEGGSTSPTPSRFSAKKNVSTSPDDY